MTETLDQFFEIKKTIDEAETLEHLQFISVNTTFKYIKYKKAILAINCNPIKFSGSENIDQNSNSYHWYKDLFKSIKETPTKVIDNKDLSQKIIQKWGTYLFSQSYYLNISTNNHHFSIIFSRENQWSDEEIKFLNLIINSWVMKYELISLQKNRLKNLLQTIKESTFKSLDIKYKLEQLREIKTFRESKWGIFQFSYHAISIFKAYLIVILISLSFFIPTTMTVISPAEIVPLNPTQIKSPRDGIIESIFIEPNTSVKQGAPLIQLDDKELKTKYLMIDKTVETLNEELRQRRMKSLKDDDSRGKLVEIEGKVKQAQLELDFLKDQLNKSTISAAHNGLILSNHSSELLGKPVITGEPLMKLAKNNEMEVEVWLDIDELIDLEEGGKIKFFSLSNPFNTIEGKIQYIAHQPSLNSKNIYGYKIRALINTDADKTNIRVGYAGYAKLYGKQTSFFKWFFKKPIQFFRRFI